MNSFPVFTGPNIADASRESLLSIPLTRKNRSVKRSSGMETSDKELCAKKVWQRPDFVSFDTGMEVTAYFSRD
ncbi:pyrroloquinoline quinone precursor peptide PqqA [Streptomyces sp. NPDC093991]|uniref:pyrroloquinoline quinone precursor peptide PqqA n=1 Tax=unclassified Streptomyces TaxID=2593676 RepID=UPI00341D471A